jgi:transposase InsO family protein
MIAGRRALPRINHHRPRKCLRAASQTAVAMCRSPWQNGHVERLIGSIRRECTDDLIVLNEEHLRRILAKFSTYYNGWRPHVSLGKDAPDGRPIERFGDIVAHAILGGLHHRYARI